MLPMPRARRRAMSSSVTARVCSRPTDEHSLSTNDCTPRLTRFTPQLHQRIQHRLGDGPGSTLHGDFRAALDVEAITHRPKQPLQLIGREHRRRASAEIDRIHLAFENAAELRAPSPRLAAISAHTCSTYCSNTARENTPDAKLQKLHFVRQKGTEM